MLTSFITIIHSSNEKPLKKKMTGLHVLSTELIGFSKTMITFRRVMVLIDAVFSITTVGC